MPTVTKPGVEIFEDVDTDLEKPFHLILLDDQEHTYQYVIQMLGAVFGYAREKAFAIACTVDAAGQAILMTGGKGELEPKQNLVHSFGADPLMPESKGSMSAILEPVA